MSKPDNEDLKEEEGVFIAKGKDLTPERSKALTEAVEDINESKLNVLFQHLSALTDIKQEKKEEINVFVSYLSEYHELKENKGENKDEKEELDKARIQFFDSFHNWKENPDNNSLIAEAYKDKDVISAMRGIEANGYTKLHNDFGEQRDKNGNIIREGLAPAKWEPNPTDGTKIIKIGDKEQVTEKTVGQIKLSNGEVAQGVRSIKIPLEISEDVGGAHFTFTSKTLSGRNMNEPAIRMSFNYDESGKLVQADFPAGLKFDQNNPESIGHFTQINKEGKSITYTTGFTYDHYQQIMKEVAKNKGLGAVLEVPKETEISQDTFSVGVGKNDFEEKTRERDEEARNKDTRIKDLEEELRKVENEYLTDDLKKTRDELKKALEENKSLTDELKKTQDELEKSEAGKKDLEEKLEKSEAELKKALEENKSLKDDLQKSKGEIKSLKDELSKALEENKSLTDKNKSLEKELEKSTADNKSLSEKLEKSRTEAQKEAQKGAEKEAIKFTARHKYVANRDSEVRFDDKKKDYGYKLNLLDQDLKDERDQQQNSGEFAELKGKPDTKIAEVFETMKNNFEKQKQPITASPTFTRSKPKESGKAR